MSFSRVAGDIRLAPFTGSRKAEEDFLDTQKVLTSLPCCGMRRNSDSGLLETPLLDEREDRQLDSCTESGDKTLNVGKEGSETDLSECEVWNGNADMVRMYMDVHTGGKAFISKTAAVGGIKKGVGRVGLNAPWAVGLKLIDYGFVTESW
ncbi:hypothetical protein ACTXT7_005751 [Hymenolepis weldensis]